MDRSYIVISAPAASGLVLLPLVFFDLNQFHSGSIEIQAMLSHEIPVALFGLASSLVLFATSISWLIKKQWQKFLYSGLSILTFFVCFAIAGANGGAFLNAT